MIIIQLTPEELDARLRRIIREELAALNIHTPDKLLTRYEAAQQLQISVQTVDAWSKTGQITPIRKGNRVYFKYSELLQGSKS